MLRSRAESDEGTTPPDRVAGACNPGCVNVFVDGTLAVMPAVLFRACELSTLFETSYRPCLGLRLREPRAEAFRQVP